MAVVFPKIAAIRLRSAYHWSTMKHGHGEKLNWPICAIGIAVAEDGKVLSERTVAELVRPWQPASEAAPPLNPDHGLGWAELSDAPSFAESAYFRIAEVVSCCPVIVFHDASQTIHILDRLCEKYSAVAQPEEGAEPLPAYPPFRAPDWRCVKTSAEQIARAKGMELPSSSFQNVLETHGVVANDGIGGEAEALAALALRFYELGALHQCRPTGEGLHQFPGDDPSAWRIRGQAFCITGTLDAMPRSEAYARVVRGGGRKVPGVSPITDFLVVGNGSKGNTSKLKEAKKYQDKGIGIQVITESQFLKLLDRSNS